MKINIEHTNLSKVEEGFLDKLKEAARIVMKEHARTAREIEISISVVGEKEIRELNLEYRSVDRETDVLSFPQYELIPTDTTYLMLGDIVICRPVCERQALEFGHTYEREFLYLAVHSILHLVGYDHMTEEDKRKMRALEEQLMNKIGVER